MSLGSREAGAELLPAAVALHLAPQLRAVLHGADIILADQQFEKLVVECSMLDDGLLGRAYVKQVKSTQVPEDAEPTPEQRRRSSDQQRLQRRPSLADISAAARMAVTKAYGSDEE